MGAFRENRLAIGYVVLLIAVVVGGLLLGSYEIAAFTGSAARTATSELGLIVFVIALVVRHPTLLIGLAALAVAATLPARAEMAGRLGIPFPPPMATLIISFMGMLFSAATARVLVSALQAWRER